MADAPGHPPTGHDGNPSSAPEQPPGIPRWVKVFGITVAVLLTVMILIMLLSGGQHGPGRHLSSLGLAGSPHSSGTAVNMIPRDVSP
jgi:hypothetical protein